jgi:hypothetical protein
MLNLAGQPTQVSPSAGSQFGLSNLSPEFYFSPSNPGPITWGFGPKVWLPTATDHTVGVNKWGGGPTAVALTIQDPFLAGLIANNVWAGSGRNRLNLMTLNPFVFYNMPGGWYLVSSEILVSNWVTRDHWIVPVGGGFGRVFNANKQAMNVRAQGIYIAKRPEDIPRWWLQVQVQFLFPGKK